MNSNLKIDLSNANTPTLLTKEQADVADGDLYAAIPCVVKAQVDQRLESFVEDDLVQILRERQNEVSIGLLTEHRENTDLARKRLVHPVRYKIDTGGFGSLEMAEVTKLKETPLIVIGTGFLSMVSSPAYNRPDYVNPWPGAEYHKDYQGWGDPLNRFGIIGGNPMVIVCDEKMLNGRPVPTSWGDLAEPHWAESIVYPESEDFMKVFFLPYFITMFGREMAEKIYANCLFPSHPAEMFRRGNLPKPYPIYIMPYFFADMKANEDDDTQLVWTKEGALLSPVFISVKEDLVKDKTEISSKDQARYETVKVLLEYLRSVRFGQVLYGNGKFPVNIPGIDNNLPGPLKWIGWENLTEPAYNELEEQARLIMEKRSVAEAADK